MKTLRFPELCLFTAGQRGQPILLSASPCQKADRPCPEGCVVVWASAARWLPPFYCLALSGCLGAARPHCIGMSRGSKSRIPLNFSDEKGALWDTHSQMGWVGPWLEEGKLPEQQPCSPPSSPGIQGTFALWEGVLCWAVSLEAHIGAAANYLSISHLQGLL